MPRRKNAHASHFKGKKMTAATSTSKAQPNAHLLQEDSGSNGRTVTFEKLVENTNNRAAQNGKSSRAKAFLASTFNSAKSTASKTGAYFLAPSGRGLRPVPSFRCRLWNHKKAVLLTVWALLCLYLAYRIPGLHQKVIRYFEKKVLWSAYWCGLGILSSVGLGTGLHTFLLYLGPHIASVTLAAYECDSLKFPEPPYPDQIVCPELAAVVGNGSGGLGGLATSAVSLWAIMSKVRLEAFMWGAGTALGELPPYFMARAARLSGEEPDDEEYREFVQFLEQMDHYEGRTTNQIPNPLFDLAGITCGHFLVPFWTFFGATLIGKAILKMHIQKLFVILTFSEHHVEKLVNATKYIPKVGPSLQAPFKEYFDQQKLKLRRRAQSPLRAKTNWLKVVFEGVVVVMIGYFLLSIVNSLAQSYHKRLCKRRQQQTESTFKQR